MSSPASPSAPSEGNRRHERRKQQARIQLLGVLALVLVAVTSLVSFALTEQGRGRWPALVGVCFGFGIAMVLLFGAVWSRQNWARYVFLSAIFASGGLFGLFLLILLGNPTDAHGPGVKMVSIAVTCLFTAGTWLFFSRRIRYFTTPPGSGG